MNLGIPGYPGLGSPGGGAGHLSEVNRGLEQGGILPDFRVETTW